jgi:FMN phosphatase YigB (HAD superfamily)
MATVGLDAVIFDLGGVLLSYVGGTPFDQRWEERLGLGPGSFQRHLWDLAVERGAETGRTPEADWWSEAMQNLGLDGATAAELYEDWLALVYLHDGVAAWVRSLRPHYKLATLSNAFSDARQGCIETYGLDQMVDLMVFSAEEGLAKPDPAIYRLTLDRLEVDATSTVFFDDRTENVEAARLVGMMAVEVRSPEELVDRGRELLGPW